MTELTNSSPGPAERTVVAFETLASSAKKLNEVSGELAKPIASLERALHRLNIGVACWTLIASHDDGHSCWSQGVGYSIVNGEWRLAVRNVHGDDPENALEEVWPFNEAPLYLRTKAVDKLPDLLEAFVSATDAAANRLSKKVGPAQELAAAVDALAKSKRK
jgi:hypothetical protein